VQPPPLRVCGPLVVLSLWLDDPTDVLERTFVEGRVCFGHADSEVHNPHVARLARYVLTVHPAADDIGIRTPVGVLGREHLGRLLGLDVEWPALGVTHEGDAQVFLESAGLG
jgi:hypothetical protein